MVTSGIPQNYLTIASKRIAQCHFPVVKNSFRGFTISDFFPQYANIYISLANKRNITSIILISLFRDEALLRKTISLSQQRWGGLSLILAILYYLSKNRPFLATSLILRRFSKMFGFSLLLNCLEPTPRKVIDTSSCSRKSVRSYLMLLYERGDAARKGEFSLLQSMWKLVIGISSISGYQVQIPKNITNIFPLCYQVYLSEQSFPGGRGPILSLSREFVHRRFFRFPFVIQLRFSFL